MPTYPQGRHPYRVAVSNVTVLLTIFSDSPEAARVAAEMSLKTPYLEAGLYRIAGHDQPQAQAIILPAVGEHDPHLPVEYDEEYFGGDYTSEGAIAYIPVSYVEPLGSVEAAFAYVTGLDPSNIISYQEDDESGSCTADGTLLDELEGQRCCVCGLPAEGTEKTCECVCPECGTPRFDDVTIADHGHCYDCHQKHLLIEEEIEE